MKTQESALKNESIAQKACLGEIVKQDEGFKVLDCCTERFLPLSEHSLSLRYPEGSVVKFYARQGAAEITELLASALSAKAKIYRIVADYKQDPFFSTEVLAELETILNNPGIDDPGLVDYEHKAFCTIDGVGTRDLDQALFIEKTGTGFVVYYAIADAAYYVRQGSALFTEALKRGASFYLPDLMIPMLPRELCEGVISLNEQVKRRAVVFELGLDQDGRHVKTHIARARICSRAKLSFEQVQAYLDNPSQSPLNGSDLSAGLSYLKEVGLLRLRLAEERKVVRYHRTEIDVKIGPDGLVFNLLDTVRNAVELYNEQLSLLCNMAGARFLADGGMGAQDTTQAIYKVHSQPPEEKVAVFEQTLRRLIEIYQLDPHVWLWDQSSPKALSDFLKELPRDGKYSRIAQAINRQALITNNRSMFSGQAEQHYGVGAEVYARFSSPMREIVGIFLHKELMEKAGYQKQWASKNSDETLRDRVILMANRSKDLQKQMTKDANKLVMDQMFAADMQLPEPDRPARRGTIIGLGKDKVYVLLDEPAIEIKVYIHYLETLWERQLTIDNDQILLCRSDDSSSVACLGDFVAVVVTGRNLKLDQWVFQLQVLQDMNELPV